MTLNTISDKHRLCPGKSCSLGLEQHVCTLQGCNPWGKGAAACIIVPSGLDIAFSSSSASSPRMVLLQQLPSLQLHSALLRCSTDTRSPWHETDPLQLQGRKGDSVTFFLCHLKQKSLKEAAHATQCVGRQCKSASVWHYLKDLKWSLKLRTHYSCSSI